MVDKRKVLIVALSLTLIMVTGCAGGRLQQNGTTSWEGVEIHGQISLDSGEPVDKVYVYAYGPDKVNAMGPADAMSEATGSDGRYKIIVPTGSYILIARRRLSGSISGPMRNGDIYGRVRDIIDTGGRSQIGRDISVEVFAQGAHPDPKKVLTTGTRLKGVVVDETGMSVAEAFVFAYKDSFVQGAPDYMSEATGSDGSFVISLPGSGHYTVGARTGLRGKPRSEDMMGFWDSEKRARYIKEGTTTLNVKIILKPRSSVE